jgi:arsenite methyltransferase
MSSTIKQDPPADIHKLVRQRYGRFAAEFQGQAQTGCGCSDSASQMERIYETPDISNLPEDVTGVSLGCGDPITLATLQPGQIVMDLGAGGGSDCFLAARAVGEAGYVIGVDMTAEMIEKARANQVRLGLSNVEFRLGEIEHLPAGDATVDVIISNCVINLSPDKPQVFREAFRVLKPGGWLAVSDIVTRGPLPEELRHNLEAWASCLGGAIDINAYRAAIEAAGFAEINITPVPTDPQLKEDLIKELGLADNIKDGKRKLIIKEGAETKVITLDSPPGSEEPGELVFSAKISARKPAALHLNNDFI